MKLHSCWMFFLIMILPGGAVFASESANDIIANINSQVSERATAKAKLYLTREGEIRDLKKIDLLMVADEGKETVVGEILKPLRRRGKVTIAWKSGRVSIEHLEKRPGKRKERRLSVDLRNSFLGTGFSYEDIRIMQGPDFGYTRPSSGYILALSKGRASEYFRKDLAIEQKSDGNWVITSVRLFGRNAEVLKVQLNKDFVKAYGGWRPTRIEVNKKKSRYVTVLVLDWSEHTVFD